MHVKIVSLLEPPATLVTGKVQLSLSLVFGHVVLERCPLPALEPTDFTPRGQGKVSKDLGASVATRRYQVTLTAEAWLPNAASGGRGGVSVA